MGYRDNPINQPTGLRILRDIYDLIYLKNPGSRKNSDNRLATDNSQMPEIVSNFKQNAPRIVMMMRRFMTGNTHVQTSNAGDSGIFVCNPIPFGMAGRTGGGARGPDAAKEKGCGRRDFLWWWEFTDFGVYNNYSNWGSSVGLEPWSRNLHDPTYRNKDFQVVVGRVRCNTVNTCDPMSGGCGTTWRGSGNCPSPYCNTKRKVTAGCGRENYAIFKVSFRDPLRNYWTTGQRNRDTATGQTSQYVNGAPIPGATSEMPPKMVGILQNQKFVEDPASTPNFYRIFYQGLPPENTYLSTQEECLKYIPYIQLGYSSLNDVNNQRPNGYVCNGCGQERYAPLNPDFNTPFDIHPRITYYDTDDYQGDQHGGLCKNIGDLPGSYAGLSGRFGCACGGIFEPRLKVPAMEPRLKMIHQRIKEAQQQDASQTMGQYGNRGGSASRGITAGSGQSSNLSIYGRGDVRNEAQRAVYAEFGTVDVQRAVSQHSLINQLQVLRRKNAFPATFPLSMCRYGFVRSVLSICKNPSHRNVRWNYPGSNVSEETNFQPLIDRDGRAMDYCPTCGPNGDPAFIEPHPERFIMPPMPYTIMNRQPLTAEDSVGLTPGGGAIAQAFADRPQWSLVVKSQIDAQERYNLRIELPQVYMGDIVPSEFTPQPPQPLSDRNIEGFTCPNERQGPLEYEAQWLQTNQNSVAPAPAVESLTESQVLITQEYSAGDTTLTISPVARVAIGDYINSDGLSVGTQITNIAGSVITISTPVVEARGNLDANTGRPGMISTFSVPRVAEIVRNPLTQDSDSPLPVGCCSGRGNNYTFVVTEGKSAEAYYSTAESRWVDISPLVRYADGTTGARWTQFPETVGTREANGSINWVGSRPGIPRNASLQYMMDNGIPSSYPPQSDTGYDWCHLDDADIPANQLAQDWTGRANRALLAVLTARNPSGISAIIQGSHRIQLVETKNIPQNNIEVRYYRCRDCEAIAAVGRAARTRGEANSLIEALRTDTYYPGYAAIRHYINTGQMQPVANLIDPDGNLQLLPTLTSGLTQGYFEGAVQWETEPTTDTVDGEGGSQETVAIPAGWWKWALRFRGEIVEGGDYRI